MYSALVIRAGREESTSKIGIEGEVLNYTTIKVIYAPVPFEQHCTIQESLGCKLTEEGYIKIGNYY